MKYKNILAQAALILFLAFNGFAQSNTNMDCATALLICDNTSVSAWNNNFGTQDLNNTNNGCIGNFEHQSVWMQFTIKSGTTLDFDIIPNDPTDDYDFAVYGPNVSCGNLPPPVRCNYNGSLGSTGLSTPGGGRYDATLNVNACETYYLLIDNHPNGNQLQGFTINWGGNAVLGFTCIDPNFSMKDEYCIDEPIVPSIIPAAGSGITSYRWVIHEFIDINTWTRIVQYESPYYVGPVTSVDFRTYWNGYVVGKDYAISIDIFTPCGNQTIWSTFRIKERETFVECLELNCGEVFDPNNPLFPNPCEGELIGIEDIVKMESLLPNNPVIATESTVLRLIYDCCEVLVTLKVTNQNEIINETICLEPDGTLILEPCDPFYPPAEYHVNGDIIISDEPFLQVEYTPGGEYSVSSTSPEGCKCTIIYDVLAPVIDTVYGAWCAGELDFDLSTLIDPDCLNGIDEFTVINNQTGEDYGTLNLHDEAGGYEIFGNGGAGDLLCLRFTSFENGCVKCIINITLRFYDGNCDDEPEPIYCHEIYGFNDNSGNSFIMQEEENTTAPTYWDEIRLEQNTPDPFNSVTVIQYYLPEEAKDAALLIYNLQGKQISKIDLQASGHESVEISADDLHDGMYFYGLLVDGKASPTFKMVIAR